MKISGIKTAKALSRWVRARVSGGALILGYHRIAHAPRDSYEICVKPEHFAEQLEVLRQLTRPINLTDLAQYHKQRTLPAQSVAVTFDDGYADNLYQAKPVLEKYQIPATVFVCTGYLGKEFWWDELERLILSLPIPQQVLSLELEGNPFEWRLEDIAHDPQRVLDWIYKRLSGMAPVDRNNALQQIRIWRGADPPVETRALTVAELNELASSDWIEIGSHTITHPYLVDCSITDQRREIQQSKAILETLLNHPVTGFSFPNGSLSTETKQFVQMANYEYACTSDNDVVSKRSDLFALPRFWPGDWDGARFARWLKRWL